MGVRQPVRGGGLLTGHAAVGEVGRHKVDHAVRAADRDGWCDRVRGARHRPPALSPGGHGREDPGRHDLTVTEAADPRTRLASFLPVPIRRPGRVAGRDGPARPPSPGRGHPRFFRQGVGMISTARPTKRRRGPAMMAGLGRLVARSRPAALIVVGAVDPAGRDRAPVGPDRGRGQAGGRRQRCRSPAPSPPRRGTCCWRSSRTSRACRRSSWYATRTDSTPRTRPRSPGSAEALPGPMRRPG